MTDKKTISLRYWLLGRGYHLAHKAMMFASTFHTGTRKDGCTHEFDHQLFVALYVKTLCNHLDFPEETLATVLLHDVAEDYDVGFEEIESLFGASVANAVQLLTKKHRGDKIPADLYYKEICKDRIASVVKGADRMHNIQTMQSCFNFDKQNKYIKETEELVLPMLKQARRVFTTQEPAYENIKLILKSQIELIKAIHSAAGEE